MSCRWPRQREHQKGLALAPHFLAHRVRKRSVRAFGNWHLPRRQRAGFHCRPVSSYRTGQPPEDRAARWLTRLARARTRKLGRECFSAIAFRRASVIFIPTLWRPTLGQECRFSAPVQTARQDAQCAPLFVGEIGHGGMRLHVAAPPSHCDRALLAFVGPYLATFLCCFIHSRANQGCRRYLTRTSSISWSLVNPATAASISSSLKTPARSAQYPRAGFAGLVPRGKCA
jgi:hypothetical protein